MPQAIGIDLGTTNSVVSMYRRGTAETLPIEGRSTMPSVVSFRNDNTVMIGQTAKARTLVDPENTVASTKRFMGDRHKKYQVGGKSLSPVDVSCLILKQIVSGAKKALGEDIWDAVITVPAYFNEVQKEDTKRAAEEAGLNVLRLIPEPTAAAIAYGLDQGKNQTIIVYDLGGGTFDVSVLEVKGNSFEVKAVNGDGQLGGDDFDEAIIIWAAKQFQAQTGINLLDDRSKEAKIARQRLKEAAETAKIELSQTDKATITIPNCLGHPLQLEISLSEYNQLIEPFLQRTVDCIKSVLKDAKLTSEDIDRVILVGGSTKNKAVREIVAREIKEPFASERVDEVVAHGAAIVAADFFLPGDNKVEFKDVTGHSLGVDVHDTKTNKITFESIIPRQTNYPCKGGKLYFVPPMQKIAQINVYRGENSIPKQNQYLGELELPISPPQPDDVPVGVIFELDADGIIQFTAVQFPLDKQISIYQYCQERNDELVLDTEAVDSLIKNGVARTKVVRINSGEK